MTPGRGHLAALAAAVALLASGCGADEEKPGPGIPQQSVSRLDVELELVQKRLDATRDNGTIGSCGDIDAKSYPDIQRILDGVPRDTDADVRRALEKSIDRLKQLTESECSDLAQKIKDRQETTPTETTPTETTPQPVPQDTTPEPQQTETQPQKKEKPKDKKPKDNGNGTESGGTEAPPKGGGQPAPSPDEG